MRVKAQRTPSLIPNYIVLGLLTIFVLGPLVILGFNALKSTREIGENSLSLPKEWRVQNYSEAWEKGNYSTTIRNSIIMGSDFYDSSLRKQAGVPDLGIGRNCVIDHAIIDKNARIGHGCVITPEGKPAEFDGPNFYMRDGIVVVPKGAIIPDGTWI